MRPSVARSRRLALAVFAGIGLAAWLAAAVSAHPLGNFTINHYAGLRISRTVIALDYVLDMAEIPTFQERQRIDANSDGIVDDAEIAAERLVACGRTSAQLVLTANGAPLMLVPTAAGISFPLGNTGLETMRLVCEFDATLPLPITATTTIGYRDNTWNQRIGWREVVAIGDGVTLAATRLPAASVSRRLTSYPGDLLATPMDVESASIVATPGGTAAPAFAAPDATPLGGAIAAPGDATVPAPSPLPLPPGAIPGGVTDQISALLEVKDLTPLAIIGSLLVAMFLGAIHAVSPGHGKTVMAAYLVGSRGSARHAVALGVTVTVSHTLGVLALATVTLFASNIIPPERLYPVLGVASGGLVIGIGAWLLYGRYRIWARTRTHARLHDTRTTARIRVPARPREFGLVHASLGSSSASDWVRAGPDPASTRQPESSRLDPSNVASDDGRAHQHAPTTQDGHEHLVIPGEHSHGGVRHSHLPPSGADLTWRSLFSLGLAGGLVPSASALLLLLGSLSANRPAYGIVLVLAFGAGMAIVLGGVGLLLVYASRFVERVPSGTLGRHAWDLLPVATAVVVIGAGIYLTSQAITQVF